MIEIDFEGDEAARNEIRKIAEESGLVRSADEETGLDGAELIRLTLEYGPEIVALLMSIAAFIERCIRLRQAYKITVSNSRKTGKSRR